MIGAAFPHAVTHPGVFTTALAAAPAIVPYAIVFQAYFDKFDFSTMTMDT